MQMAGMQVPSSMMYPYSPPPVQGTGGAGAGGGSPMVMGHRYSANSAKKRCHLHSRIRDLV